MWKGCGFIDIAWWRSGSDIAAVGCEDQTDRRVDPKRSEDFRNRRAAVR
jgi:hypothetical protein